MIVTVIDTSVALSTSESVASTSATASGGSPSVNVPAKLVPAATLSSASRSRTGGLLKAPTVSVVVAVFVSTVPSLATNVITRAIVPGVSEVLS